MFQDSPGELIPKLLNLGADFLRTAILVLLIVGVAYISIKLLRLAFNRMDALLIRASQDVEKVPVGAAQRIRTLTSVLWTIAVGLVWFVAVLTVLGQMGVNVGPILAGAGVVGLAVGFGAQNLVRDLVSGFFLILEDQIRVGDIAVINGTGGLVEGITFRTVVLRDLEGAVHVFPNGTIQTLANRSKDWSAYVIDVGVAYKEDTDRVVEVMRSVASQMKSESEFGGDMLEPIEIYGVDDFTDSAVNIKARLRTVPLRQAAVGREYRRRLKKAFDAAGIEIPFPHRTLYMGKASSPFEFVAAQRSSITAA
jgi:small conductance mechanosensitive channel